MTEMTSESIGAFHPSKALFRFTILLFVSLLTYGSYFVYDGLAAIAPILIKSFDITRAEFGAIKPVIRRHRNGRL